MRKMFALVCTIRIEFPLHYFFTHLFVSTVSPFALFPGNVYVRQDFVFERPEPVRTVTCLFDCISNHTLDVNMAARFIYEQTINNNFNHAAYEVGFCNFSGVSYTWPSSVQVYASAAPTSSLFSLQVLLYQFHSRERAKGHGFNRMIVMKFPTQVPRPTETVPKAATSTMKSPFISSCKQQFSIVSICHTLMLLDLLFF